MKKKGAVVWLTGLPCSGKTTIAERVVDKLSQDTMHLDGDVMRQGICANLGFSDEDRTENLRRTAHMAKFLADNGATVFCSFVSPMLHQREMVRNIIGHDRFLLVYVACSPKQCATRDVKGMWAKAKAGEIKDFTGHSAPYKAPGLGLIPYFMVHTDQESVEESTDKVIAWTVRKFDELNS